VARRLLNVSTMDTTLRARDLMERDIITVSPETPILDIHRLFVEEEIHGAPVVGEDGIVYGVVSALDLLRAVREDEEVCESTAADAMTKALVMVAPDASIEEVARTMREQRIHRVLVGQDRMLEGVLTTFDLLRVLSPR
jgi:CBS domain-containing protein